MTNEEIEIEEGKMKTIVTMFDKVKVIVRLLKTIKLMYLL